MSEINRILEDESNNDKELIRELSVYVKNHRDKGLPINKKFVEDVASIILRNSEIDYDEIILNNDNSRLGDWWLQDGVVELNLTEILNNSKYLKKICLKSKVGDNKIFAYYETIGSIIHELTHARQDYVTTPQNNIYASGKELVSKDYMTYHTHHDEALNERYANLREKVITYQVLSYIYPPKQVNQLRYEILYFLLYGYKVDNIDEVVDAFNAEYIHDCTEIISAIDNYNSVLDSVEIDKVNMEPTEDMTLYDRLYLGLPITLEEYTNIIDLYRGIHKQNGDVKKLINKL